MNTMAKSKLGQKGLIWLKYPEFPEGNQGQNLEAGTDEEAIEGAAC